MSPFELESFVAAVGAGSDEEVVGCVLRTPVILSPGLWPELERWAAGQPPEVRGRAGQILELLPAISQHWTNKWFEYPAGPGPLDEVLRRLEAEEIDGEQAKRSAAEPDVVRKLGYVYVRARIMQLTSRAHQGDWKSAMPVEEAILAAVDARRSLFSRDQSAMECIVATEYAATVANCVHETADGRAYRAARKRLMEARGKDTEESRAGAVEYALGALHLDPYIKDRNSRNFRHTIEAWMRLPFERLANRLTDELAAELAMPQPLDAFTEASGHFLNSANLRSGVNRGFSLKGHIEAEFWKTVMGGTGASVSQYAEEAKGLLPGDRYTELRAAIETLARMLPGQAGAQDKSQLAQAPQSSWIDTGRKLMATPSADLVKEHGLAQATHLLQRVSEAVGAADSWLALEIWRKNLPLMEQRGEQFLDGFLQAGIGCVAGVGAPLKESYISFVEAAHQVQAEARQQAWKPEKCVGTLLALAARSQVTNQDLEGVEVVRMAAGTDEGLAREWQALFLWFTARMYRGEASNQFDAGRFDLAMQAYAVTALFLLQAGMVSEAGKILEMGADLVDRDHSQIGEFIRCFGTVIPMFERLSGADAVQRVADLGRKFFPWAWAAGPASGDTFLFFSLLKGVLFSSSWRRGGELAWIDSADSREQLGKIESLEKEMPASAGIQNPGDLGLDDLLVVYAEDTEFAEGTGPESTLHNLQVKYNDDLRRELGLHGSDELKWLPEAGSVAARLGAETALLIYFAGITPGGNTCVYTALVTDDSCTMGMFDFGIPGMRVFLGRNQYPADISALTVSAVRRNLETGENKPIEGLDGVDLDVVAAMGRQMVGGPTGELLQKLREAGKWHLCVIPSGPAHFLPFHLLPYGEGLLGDEWAVTYLPTLGMLEPREATASTRSREMASFGLEFQGGQPHGLPPIPGAEQEARAVAGIYGAEALTGPDVTQERLEGALVEARRIHLSTHGALAVSAPSFQRIYLWPDGKSDGILHAFEILRHNLRGLEVLTLSACETGLGRIDRGDNLLGFAANALIAGTETVIGTLWPVGAGVTQEFFQSFHAELKGGAGKREAFQTAQLTTREKFPEPAHWGAFWYMGLW